MKRRYATLDAMRGVAAVVVLIYHVQGLYGPSCSAPGACDVRFGHLAVDMFFALSGFVISLRYDSAFLAGLTFGRFMRLRIVRLAPTYWLGAALGLLPLLKLFAPGIPVTATLKALAFNALLLPAPTPTAYIAPFPLLPPAWSLFFELWVANVIFAALGKRLDQRVLYVLVGGGAAGLVGCAYEFGSLDVGSLWSTFAGGFPRVIYSFFAGVAVQRLHARKVAGRVPSALILAVLVASFVIRVPATAAPFYELACVLLLYPALIYLGASAVERRPAIGKLLGEVSYALYVVHIPLLLWVQHKMPTPSRQQNYSVAIYFMIDTLVFAWLVATFYDAKARSLLSTMLDRIGFPRG